MTSRNSRSIDLGSGKGRVLLMASNYPFHRIVGVELLPELHRIAMKNVKAYKSSLPRCFALECVVGDALDFVFPVEPTVALFVQSVTRIRKGRAGRSSCRFPATSSTAFLRALPQSCAENVLVGGPLKKIRSGVLVGNCYTTTSGWRPITIK